MHGGWKNDLESLKTPLEFESISFGGGRGSEGSCRHSELLIKLERFGVTYAYAFKAGGILFKYRDFRFWIPTCNTNAEEIRGQLFSFLQFVRREDLIWRKSPVVENVHY